MHSLLEAITQWFLCNEIINSHLEPRWTFSMPLLYGKICSFSCKLWPNPLFWDSKSGAQATTHGDSSQWLQTISHILPPFTQSKVVLVYNHHITLFFNYPCPSFPQNIQPVPSTMMPQEQNEQGRKSSLKIGYCSGWEAGCPPLHLLSPCTKSLLDKQTGIIPTTQEMSAGIAPI